MSYSGAATAKTARESLGKSLASLQEDPNIPPDVLAVAQNLAQAVGALFEAERASSEPDGKAAVKTALSLVGQTLALLQDVRGQHRGIQTATETLAHSMSLLYPLSQQPSMRPPAAAPAPGGDLTMPLHAPQVPQFSPSPVVAPVQPQFSAPQAPAAAPQAQFSAPQAQFSAPQAQFSAPQAQFSAPQAVAPQAQFSAPVAPVAAPAPAPQPQAPSPQPPAQRGPQFSQPQAAAAAVATGYRDVGKREEIEVNIGATTESNFYVGFSGEVAEGGVFAATYGIHPRGTAMRVHITLPGGFDKIVLGTVRFVRDPMDMSLDETVPGMGIQFEGLDAEARELILRFMRKRPPMFYDE